MGLSLGLHVRLSHSSGGASVPTGGVMEAEIMGTAMPTVAGELKNQASNGKILRVRIKGIGTSATFDPTKCSFTVRRPGYNTSKVFSAANVEETVYVTGLYRLAYPNGGTKLVEVVGSDLDIYLAMDKSIFVDDDCLSISIQSGFYGACVDHTQLTVTNNSSRPYDMPQVDNLAQPPIMRLGTDGLSVEWAVMHHGARGGQTVAAVDCYIVDNTASPGSANRLTQTATSMTTSARVTPYAPPCYAFTFANSTGLTNGLGGMSIKVYPWIGNATWDLADYGGDEIIKNEVPAFWPVCIDSDNSYKTARAYVSHSGSTVGSPTFTTSALGAYSAGVTPAYATIAAAMAAGKTWNNNGSNRTRAHNDCGGLEIVIPSGTATAGFGGNMSTTILCGNGPLPRVTIESGASQTNTGIAGTATAANRLFTHLDMDGCGLFPGTPGTGAHQIVDGGYATSVDPASLQAAAMLVVRNCSGTTTGDYVNLCLYRVGYAWQFNNTFSGIEPHFPNYTLRGASVIHGGTYNSDVRAVPGFMNEVHRIIGAKFRQLNPNKENAARTFEYPVGGFIGWNFFSFNGGSGANPNAGSGRAAIGNRGLAVVGNIFRSTNNTSPCLQIHADYGTGDQPAIRNLNLWLNTFAGNRLNLLYLEINNNTDVKEGYTYGNAGMEWNTKADYFDPDAGGATYYASAYRTGNWAHRFGVDRGWNRLSGTSTGGGGYGYTSAAWLGDVAAIGDVSSIGASNMYTTDTSATGTNTFATDGDWHPQTALRNAIPTGRAPWKNDLFGVTIPNDGTGAAGAVQV